MEEEDWGREHSVGSAPTPALLGLGWGPGETCPYPPTHPAEVLAFDLWATVSALVTLYACSSAGCSSKQKLRPRGPRAACQVVAHTRGSSLLGVNDALSPAVLPLVLLFLPPPAHSRQGLDLGAMPLCCCQGSREPDPSYAGKRPGLSKCLR